MIKKILSISLTLFLVWGCGSGGSDDTPPAPTVSYTPSISWNMSSSVSVEENSNGATLIDVTLINSTAQIDLSLSGTDSSKFSISDGYLVFTETPDFENPSDSDSDNSYSLTITAAGAGISSTQSVTLNVTNVNESPSFVTDSSSYFQVNENTTSIIQIVASDPENDTLSFSLQDSSGTEDETLLDIDTATGEVSFKTAPNFELPLDLEADNALTFTVVANDGSLSASKKYYASVSDVKENPTEINLSSNSALENTAGIVFGTISLLDDDPVGIKSVNIAGTDAIYFEIGQSMQLKLKSSVTADYETKSSYSISLTVTDADDITLTSSFTLNVENINEIPVISDLSSSLSLAENQTSVVTVSASDPEGSTLAYSLTGTDASSLSISSAGVLTFNSATNYESKSSYSITVNVSDGTNTASQALTLTVTDVNESPTDISITGTSVNENIAGASFGTLSTADEDGSETSSYSLSGSDATSFEISSSNVLKFKSSVSGNYESKSSYSVTVTVTDSASNTYSESLTLYVANVNESPSFTTSSSISIAENGTAVVSLVSTDPDCGTSACNLYYSLGSGNDSSKFTVSEFGALTFNRAPDYEIPGDSDENNTYLVNLIVTDGTNSTTLTMTVTVTDVTEASALETPDAVQTVETK